LSRYVFPGHPIFLQAAAQELGRPESADPARRVGPLTALANLCAQAAHAEAGHVAGILAKAAEFRDQLATALRAADLMLLDVQAGLSPSTPAEAGAEVPSPPPAPAAGRGRARTARDPS